MNPAVLPGCQNAVDIHLNVLVVVGEEWPGRENLRPMMSG